MKIKEILKLVDEGKLSKTLLLHWVGEIPQHLVVLGVVKVHILPQKITMRVQEMTLHIYARNRVVIIPKQGQKADFMDEEGYQYAEFEIVQQF